MAEYAPNIQTDHLREGTLPHFKTPKKMNPKIDSILPFIGEYAVASVLCDKKEKYGVINRSGAFVIPPLWDMIDYRGGDLVALSVGFYRGRDCCDEDDGIWTIGSISGKSVTQTEYSQIHPWGDDLHFTAFDLETGLCGVANIYGDIIIPFEYDYLHDFIDSGKDLILAHKNGKVGYLTPSGEVIIPLIYDNISPIFSECPDDWFTVEKDGECYYINQDGERVLL